MCYGKPITILEDDSLNTAATTLTFAKDNVCSWRLRSVSEYYFNKQIKVEITAVNGVDCHIANGDTIATAINYFSCTAGKTYYFNAN